MLPFPVNELTLKSAAPPPISPQLPSAYPSKLFVVDEYRNIPTAGEASLCAVVPTGTFTEPVVFRTTPPVNSAPDKAAFVAIELVTLVEKLESSPKAVANSLKVSKAAGEEATRFETDVSV